jgi:hypothetical protein
VLFTKYYRGNNINKDEIYSTCSTHWKSSERNIQLHRRVLKGGHPLGGLGVEEKVILKWILQIDCVVWNQSNSLSTPFFQNNFTTSTFNNKPTFSFNNHPASLPILGNSLFSSCLRHYATSRKIVRSSPDWVIDFFSFYLILPAALGPGVHSAYNRNEYQKQNINVSGKYSAAGE